jgi:hypothetical protein
MPILRCIIATNDVHFISCFPPCTEFASSGARWWASKAQNDRYFQAKAALIVEQCRTFAETVGAPYFIENPVGALTSIIGKQSYAFHPYYFTNFAPEDNYTKRTFLWTGNGFVMPPDNINTDLDLPDANRIHFCSPGKDRANKRSMTPYGFAKAVYEANKRL